MKMRLVVLSTVLVSVVLTEACNGGTSDDDDSSGAGANGSGAGSGDGDGDAPSGGGSGDGDGDGDGSFSDGPSGLTSRPANPNCIAPERATYTGPVAWENQAGLGLDGMTMMRQLPDGSWIDVTRSGQIHGRTSAGARHSLTTVPNVSTTGETGLLGLEVHPSFETSPYIYVYYMTLESGDVHIRIDRFTVTGTGASMAIDGASRESILNFDRGLPSVNHVGGTIEFQPDSDPPMLYVAMGDGENRDAVFDLSKLNGKLLRIDVDGGAPYTPDIVGVGFRNPFRWSFDSFTGDLWIGDVGEGAREEVTHVLAAGIPTTSDPLNFGWPIMEGSICRAGGDPATYCGGPAPAILPLIGPTNEYDHTVGISVIGGRVYRGTEVPGAYGTYFFQDIFPQSGQSGWRLLANPSEDPGNPTDDYLRDVVTGGSFYAYVEDRQGELYAIDFSYAGVRKLVAGPGGETPPETMPTALSDTGCFDGSGEAESGLVPYDLNSPLWSDGATKRRWLSLPDGENITLEADGDFTFPPGTVLAKEFTLDGVRVETRLFVRHPDGIWAGYSYAWINDAGATLADGELLPDEVVTRTPASGATAWSYPSRSQCTQCHTSAAGDSLGVELGQLNREFDYPGGTTANQITTLSAIGMLDGDVDTFFGHAFPEYDDASASLDDRTWAYLHSNCSGCHRPGALGNQGRSAMPDLRFDLLSEVGGAHPLATRLCSVVAGAGDLGLGEGALLVEPGAPGDWADLASNGSVLYLRMSARASVPGSTGTMPLIGTALLDEEFGLPLVSDWITALSCP